MKTKNLFLFLLCLLMIDFRLPAAPKQKDAEADDLVLEKLDDAVLDESEEASTAFPTRQLNEAAAASDAKIEEELSPAVPPPPPIAAPEIGAEEELSPSPAAPTVSNSLNAITNLEFKMTGDTSRITVTSKESLNFKELKNPQIKQIVYVFENTETPNRLQRAYDTMEFQTPVALFTLLQLPNRKDPLSKLIIQMRENKVPKVTAHERGIYIDFPVSDLKTDPRIIVGDSDKLISEENIYSGSHTFSGKPISRLEIKDSDIRDVLRLIVKSSGFNLVIGDDVTGKIGTMSLQNVPWDQAFALVLQSKKLGYVKQGNVIRVASLNALKSEKEESVANENSKIKVESLKTVLIPISYAKASELSAQAKNFLTERGTIDVDQRTNTIIVKDIDRAVTRVQKLFSALDTQPARVSISAKIMEMNTSFSRNIGFRKMEANQQLGGVNIDQKILFDNKGTTITTIKAPTWGNLLSEFRIGELENKVKTLANPSVSVVANQQASITQSLSFFVINGDAVAGGQVIPGVRQITANLNMDVTPIVSGDGSIFMNVNLRNEIPVGVPPDIRIDSRNVQTQVLVENGDTAVVGGIFQNTVNTAKEGVPFLMRIPILGFFFSRSSLTDTKNEIFVFLTAKLLNPEEAFQRTL